MDRSSPAFAAKRTAIQNANGDCFDDLIIAMLASYLHVGVEVAREVMAVTEKTDTVNVIWYRMRDQADRLLVNLDNLGVGLTKHNTPGQPQLRRSEVTT